MDDFCLPVSVLIFVVEFTSLMMLVFCSLMTYALFVFHGLIACDTRTVRDYQRAKFQVLQVLEGIICCLVVYQKEILRDIFRLILEKSLQEILLLYFFLWVVLEELDTRVNCCKFSLVTVEAGGVTFNIKIYFDSLGWLGIFVIHRVVEIVIFYWSWRQQYIYWFLELHLLSFDSLSLLWELC